jgi:hypothetical protein
MADIRTVKIPFKDLVFLEDNPRKIAKDDLERLSSEIQRDPAFFDSRPCLVNYTEGRYIVYAGFQRAHAANKLLKWKEIPCSVENDLPTEVMRRRAILDNTHAGKWDADTLANWEFEPEELAEMWVNPAVWGGDVEGRKDWHDANTMTEEDLDTDEEFDPIGVASGVQRVVFIFDNKEIAESWVNRVNDLTGGGINLKKFATVWQVNLSTLFT